jgi:hypothetical protein
MIGHKRTYTTAVVGSYRVISPSNVDDAPAAGRERKRGQQLGVASDAGAAAVRRARHPAGEQAGGQQQPERVS